MICKLGQQQQKETKEKKKIKMAKSERSELWLSLASQLAGLLNEPGWPSQTCKPGWRGWGMKPILFLPDLLQKVWAPLSPPMSCNIRKLENL